MSDYELQTNRFLMETGTTVHIRFNRCDKYFTDDTDNRNIYGITIERDSEKMELEFGDSLYNTRNGVNPTAYDILSCLTKYDPGSFEEFIDEFGYEYSKKSEMIYNSVLREYADVCRVFSGVLTELSEIQ